MDGAAGEEAIDRHLVVRRQPTGDLALRVSWGELTEAPAPPTDEAGAPKQNVFMAPTPLFHVTANNCLLHPATISGSRIVFTYKWDAGRALELIERERVTNFSGVPTMSREMLMHPDWERRDTSSLAGMGGGGAPLQPDLVEKIDKSLAGGAPSTGYGLTETHGIVTANSGSLYVSKPSSCGRVVPCLDAKLVDDAGNERRLGTDDREIDLLLGRDFEQVEGVSVSDPLCAMPLAAALREQLVAVNRERSASVGDRFAALTAGCSPAIPPMSSAAANPPSIADGGTRVAQPLTLA